MITVDRLTYRMMQAVCILVVLDAFLDVITK